jgi:hypothetical protein
VTHPGKDILNFVLKFTDSLEFSSEIGEGNFISKFMEPGRSSILL